MLNLKKNSQIFQDSLITLKRHTQAKLIQKLHHNSSLFYLKTSSDPNSDQQIFSLNLQSTPNRKTKIIQNTHHRLNHSLNLKSSFLENLSPLKHSDFIKNNKVSLQRINKKFALKDSQQLKTEEEQVSVQKVKDSNFSPQLLKRNDKGRKRNYFNVKEFIKNEEMKKNRNAVVMMKSNMNSALRKWRQNQFVKKDTSIQKIKSLQFNAIQVIKNIVDKKTSSNDRIFLRRNDVFLKPKKWLEQSPVLKQNQIQPHQDQQKNDKQIEKKEDGKLWRSHSYQLPKNKKRMIISDQIEQGNKKQNNKHAKEGRFVRDDRYDNMVELNPWSSGREERMTNFRAKYMGIKTQRIEQKKNQDENQFIYHYMRTSRNDTAEK